MIGIGDGMRRHGQCFLQNVRADAHRHVRHLAQVHPLVAELALPGQVDLPLHEGKTKEFPGRSAWIDRGDVERGGVEKVC